MKMEELKKLDIEEIENKIGELKGSLLKNNIEPEIIFSDLY